MVTSNDFHVKLISSLRIALILITWDICDGAKTIEFGYKGWSPSGELNCFTAMYQISFLGCVKECQVRIHCRHLVYDPRFYLCQLCESDPDIDTVQVPGVITQPKAHWGQIWLADNCVNTTCPTNSKCNSSGLCTLSECSDPPSVKGAVLSSALRGIGSSVRYQCDTDLYIDLGWPLVTCQVNGMWSDSGIFSCENGWRCRHWSHDDRRAIAEMSEEKYCNSLPNCRYTKGDDSRAPGCGGCWCCQRV